MISLFMMTLGIFLEFNKGAGIQGVSQGILLILPLVCLVTLSPLISIPLKLEGYFEAVNSLLRNLLHHPKRMFAGITTSLFILSPILSLGSVRLVNEFLADLKIPSAMSAKSYLIGFSTAIMWSPYFASVSLVLYYLEMPVGKYILYGLGLSFLSLLVGNLLFAVWERQHPLNQNALPEIDLESNQRNKLIKLALFVLILISTSLTIEYVTKWSMIVIVSLISLIIPLIWGLFNNGWARLCPHWQTYKEVSIPMMNNEIMLFTSAGLLGHAIQGTSFANDVSYLLTNIAGTSLLLFSIAVMAIILIFTYVGLHQIAVITALAMQLNPEEIGISTLALAMLLILSWATSTVLSPFSGLNLMVSRFVGKSGFEVGFHANGLHLSVVSVIGIFIIMIIR
ncbi:hypothetical protein [Anaerobacillus alkalilacustris]|uniref:hypothetical protein n=1 Tax=Anaerobacillus alkalilacustris TaxID=393763 RepID=UPI001113784F|nr:hypothetical protein [Anaerobacillus alkalilacustris]